jgi:ParB family chromosome partitioning protein
MAKRALGRGLDALFTDSSEAVSEQEAVQNVSLDEIVSKSDQPRKEFDEAKIDELARSIRGNGIIQPIVLRKCEDGYEIVVGERRFRAAKRAGLKEIPAIIKQLPDEKLFDLALVENIQREDLNPIEEAQAYRSILQRDTITQEELSKRVGKSRSYIANMVRILELPDDIKNHVSRGTISVGQAKAILSLRGKEEQRRMVDRIINEKLSVREVESITKGRDVPRGTEPAGKSREKTLSQNPFVEDMEERLRTKYGTKVTIDYRKGRGAIKIAFYSDDDLERLFDEIG